MWLKNSLTLLARNTQIEYTIDHPIHHHIFHKDEPNQHREMLVLMKDYQLFILTTKVKLKLKLKFKFCPAASDSIPFLLDH